MTDTVLIRAITKEIADIMKTQQKAVEAYNKDSADLGGRIDIIGAKLKTLGEFLNEVYLDTPPPIPEVKYVVKPWGQYEVLDKGNGWLLKKMTINPGQRTSLQSHEGRNELWMIVQGIAKITKEEETTHKVQFETVKIGMLENHRIANPSDTIPLVLIEIQYGDYISEDDIIRIDDDYDRIPQKTN